MKKIKVLLSMLLLSVASAAFAQINVKGVVTDASNGDPIPAASVVIKGTLTGATANLDGEYSINVPSDAVLVFSSVGFKNQEIAVSKSGTVNCALQPDAELINDLVVIAYGTQSAKTVTAAVSSVKADALKDAPNVSFDAMLQGQAAGVQVATPNGGVGQTSKIFIRGISSISGGTDPLYIVDGIPITNSAVLNEYTEASAIADINPADILSIDVLKDAAATALYGSRAASGVVIITTKQGRKGEAKVTYDVNVGLAAPTRIFDMMNAQEYVAFKNMALVNRYGTSEVNLGGGASAFGPNAFNIMQIDGKDVDTKWSDLIYKKGLVQNHTLAIQGGTDRTTYYISANYTDQNGIVIGDHYNRAGFKANASTQVNKYLKVGLSGQFSKAMTTTIDGSRLNGVYAAAGLPRQAMIIPSILPAYNADGSYYVTADGQYIGTGGTTIASLGYPNPMTAKENFNNVGSTRIIASGFAEVTPIKNLVLKTQYGVDHLENDEETFWDPEYGQGANYPGYSWRTFSRNTDWTWTNTANYGLSFGEHSFDFLAGMEAYESSYGYDWINASEILNPLYDGFAAGYSTYNAGAEYGNKALVSYFGRINYDYAAKYMVSLNFRRDGLSSLGANSRWGNFYGASAAWRVSEEPFFEPLLNVVNDFKINASYGVVGNSEIGYYTAQSYYADGVYGGLPTMGMAHIGDANLAWESSTKYDLGASFSLFNRIDVDVDYYYTRSDNLVLAVPQAPSTGVGSLVSNAGALKNSGVEISIGAEVIRTKDFSWNTNFNFTTVNNKVLRLAEGIKAIYADDDTDQSGCNVTLPGYSMSQLYVYPTGGIDPETGCRVFYGENGERTLFSYNDGGWFLEDGTEYIGKFSQVIAGNTLPTYYGGWTNNFRYKGFDLNLMMQFSGGNYIYNGNAASGADMRWWNNFKDVPDNCWKQPGDKAKYAFPVYGDNYSNGSAMEISDWVERGDYLRMKQISLGYTFRTGAKREKLGFSSVRVYGQVQNAFVITAYSGLDPEVVSSYTVDQVGSMGFDKNTLPQARTWSLGAQITF